METIAETNIDLFAENPPSPEQIKQVSDFVHSSEANRLSFDEKVQEKMSKTSAKAVLATGIALYILGKNQEAVSKLEKAEKCKEKFTYLAYALRRMGKFKEAIENLQKSQRYDADSPEITLQKADTYRQASDFENAAKELKTLANFENVSSEYHYRSAMLQEAQGLYEQAMENYETALELSPDNTKVLFRMAYRSDLSGDQEAAIDYYKQIISKKNVFVNALINLAVIYEDKREFEKAEKYVDKVLKCYPNHQRAILFKKDIESSKTMYYDEEKEKKKDRKNQILETPISDFELSVRSRNCLRKMKINTIGDLLKISEIELLSYKNFGETSLQEIKSILQSKMMHLGMALETQKQPLPEIHEESTIQEQGLANKPVSDLQLSVRARKCLQQLNIQTIGQVVQRTEAELLGCKNFGVTSLNEIKKSLSNLGLFLRNLE